MAALRLLLFFSAFLFISVLSADKYTIQAKGIRASFVEYGASITNLWVKDRYGVMTDVILGFDQASDYWNNPWKPRYGPIVGRYANRIRNGRFTLDGKEYQVPCNDHGGRDALHGGTVGYDARDFQMTKKTRKSITFTLVDDNGFMGFPGRLVTQVKYSVEDGGVWKIDINSSADARTPVMLSQHTYWNLDAFRDPDTPLATNHMIHLPRSTRRIGVDDILVPTGEILFNNDQINNFTVPKALGADIYNARDNCGQGCTGYDNAYIVDAGSGPVASLWSQFSGIRLDIFTGEQAFQIYSCNGMDGSIPLKSTQGSPNLNRPSTVQKYGCVVMEVEGWLDAINHPEWNTPSQIYGPDRPYKLKASYKFSNI